MMPDARKGLALDVGGANLKAVHEDGQAVSVPFEVWKHPEDLAQAIARMADSLPLAAHVVVTMTAELCDCYSSKADGVRTIVDAVVRALPGLEIEVWCIDRKFHSPEEVRERPFLAAAANWLALAEVCARLIPDRRGLLIDVGSTTTDLIPLDRGRAVPIGGTDTERLQTGELVYAGVRRTPVCALGTELPFHGRPTGLAAELFATTLDVYLTLGEVASDPMDCSTADGRPATSEAALDRLARMVGADRENFSLADAAQFAADADRCLVDRLRHAAEKACRATIGQPESIVVAGSGEFLARRTAERIIGSEGPILSLRALWGEAHSNAACARALLILAADRRGPERGIMT